MKVLVLLKLAADAKPADLAALEAPEAQRVWELYEAGDLLEIYLFADGSGAALVLRAGDADAALALTQSLPMVAAGKLEPQALPLTVWPQMSKLLAKHGRDTPAWMSAG